MGWGWRGPSAVFQGSEGKATLSKVNVIPGRVQLGCGVTTKEIRGRPYLYFWHYEDRGGRRVQLFRYLGASRSESARAKLEEALDAYVERLTAEIRRRRGEILARVVSP